MMGALLATDETDEDELMPRDAAARYLARRLGRPITGKGLQNLAHRGGGPRFGIILRRATYRRADLDAWIAETLSGGPKKRD